MAYIVFQNQLRDFNAKVNLVMDGRGTDVIFGHLEVYPPGALIILKRLAAITDEILLQDENCDTARELTGDLRLGGVPASRIRLMSSWLK